MRTTRKERLGDSFSVDSFVDPSGAGSFSVSS
jgi:hypothetical protein